MPPARPLHDILTEVAGADAADPAAALRAGGHGDLPEGLVAEAIVSYADTATVEVAEHLAPFVQGHSTVPSEDPADPPGLEQGLALLASAPAPVPAGTAPESAPPAVDGDADADYGSGAARDPEGPGDPLDLAFGEGGTGGGTEAPAGEAGPVPSAAGLGGVDEAGSGYPAEPGYPGEPGSPEPAYSEPAYSGVGPDPADLFPPPAPAGPGEADPEEPGNGGVAGG